MARGTVYDCSHCSSQWPQWHGQCPDCGAWNTLVEGLSSLAPLASEARARRGKHPRGNPRARAAPAVPVPLAQVGATPVARMSTGIGELDRVLGGGLVPGALVLLGGAPGIGKSTLTNMVLAHLQHTGHRTLYVSGEESAEQVRLRAERLVLAGEVAAGPAGGGGGAAAAAAAAAAGMGGGAKAALQVPVLAETDLDATLDVLASHAPQACVIDSVQTLRTADAPGAPGSVGQIREATARIMGLAKAQGTSVILVGHVTKDGALAGPRVLEHLVDCVLQFEGERERPYRELRALKNRFGSTNEAGLFEMRQGGLVEVLDASARFVAEATCAPGSVVLAAMEGSRPLLVEVQALVSPSELEQPRRLVSGLDRNRLALILAILRRHGGVALGGADVFVNVVGGVRLEEPGCDLAIALAVASASRGTPIEGRLSTATALPANAPSPTASAPAGPRACFGELGLTGELRWVGHPERRLQEALRHGLSGTIAPPGSGAGSCAAATLREALALALPSGEPVAEQANRAPRLAA